MIESVANVSAGNGNVNVVAIMIVTITTVADRRRRYDVVTIEEVLRRRHYRRDRVTEPRRLLRRDMEPRRRRADSNLNKIKFPSSTRGDFILQELGGFDRISGNGG